MPRRGSTYTGSGSPPGPQAGWSAWLRRRHGSDNIPGGVGSRSMRRTAFNDGWTVGSTTNSFAELVMGAGSEPTPVTLPHDAVIGLERSPEGRAANGFFPGGNWEYKKSFDLGDDGA